MGAERELLVVEDDDAFARTLQRSFERRGYTVLRASDIGQAREIVASREPGYAVVDLKLAGGASGLACVQMLHEHDPGIRGPELEQEPLREVRRPDGDPVAGTKAGGEERTPRRSRTVAQLGIHPADAELVVRAVDERVPRRPACRRIVEQLTAGQASQRRPIVTAREPVRAGLIGKHPAQLPSLTSCSSASPARASSASIR